MSALSTPGGGSTTAQNKPASGKQKFQKLDINSLYFAHKNENSEPSSIKSQLSRKHGMQSLGKVPSARRPPANLPSLKTETGQDTSAISTPVTVTVPAQTICTTQTTTTTSNSNVAVGTGPGGWVALPPPSSPHFRTEFPSLEAAAQPSHRSSDHSTPQLQLRPQTEGSWTSGGNPSVRQETASTVAVPVVATPATQQIPALRTILPPFLVKGSSGGGLGLGALGTQREGRSSGSGQTHTGAMTHPRPAHRPPATPRAVEVLTARPILRDDQISSLDDISRDAGWAQHDDIDYDQKLDFSDGESSAPTKTHSKSNIRASVDTDRHDTKIHEHGDEDQLWAERRQRQNNEVAQAVARARQRKEEEQRRQMRDTPSQSQSPKELRDRVDRDRNENRERDTQQKEKIETRERADRDRMDNREIENIDLRERETRDKDRNDIREREIREVERNEIREKETREKERSVENRERERANNRDRFEPRDRDRDRERDRDHDRERTENRDKSRMEHRDRGENDKERMDIREKDRNDNRDRIDRDRFDRDRERDRGDRDRNDRDRERDFRERDRDYGRDRDQNNPAFSKTFQANIPPRFLKQQQNRQEDHKGWAFSGKQAPRRQEPPAYSAPRHAPHNGRRSYSRDYSDREDDFRRDGSGPQWRSEMQDFERPRELDRSNSKDSYKDVADYKDRRNESDKKNTESNIDSSSRSAAEKLSEVFERKSIGVTESITSEVTAPILPVRKNTPSLTNSERESSEREFSKTSWAEVTQEDPSTYTVANTLAEKPAPLKDDDLQIKESLESKIDETEHASQPTVLSPPTAQPTTPPIAPTPVLPQTYPHQRENNSSNIQNAYTHQQTSLLPNSLPTNQTLATPVSILPPSHDYAISKKMSLTLPKVPNQNENIAPSQPLKLPLEQKSQQNIIKPVFSQSKSDRELPETELISSVVSNDPINISKVNETQAIESLHASIDTQRRSVDIKGNDKINNEHLNKILMRDPIERKSSGSGSDKRSRGYGGGGGGYAVYNRGWGNRESRGRRSHRNSRSNNRASESDASTEGASNIDQRERRRAPRSPRGSRKHEKPEDINQPAISQDQTPIVTDCLENREPFAPRGQPSRRGRGGFQSSSRPPAPAKRVTGYGPPNTKSPFSHANRAVKENEEVKDNLQNDDKGKGNNKQRAGSSTGRGRDRRPKGTTGPLSGEDENWETTSEHSEGGATASRRRLIPGGQLGQSQKSQSGRNQNLVNRQNTVRNSQGVKKENIGDTTNDITESISDHKLIGKKDDESVDDGFQEVRNKKTSKDARVPVKEENQQALIKQPRSHSNQGGGRNGSSSRNSNDKSNSRNNNVPVTGKPGTQYERPRQPNLAPRFVKQRQKQQLGLGFGPDTGAAPPPPTVNAWDKPISQTLRGNTEEPVEIVENKLTHSNQRSTSAEVPVETKLPVASNLVTDKSGVLDGATPPVETIIFENTNYKTSPPEEALQQKYQLCASIAKVQPDEITAEIDPRPMAFNGDVRTRPRSIQELIGDNPRQTGDGDPSLSLQISYDTTQKTEDTSDIKLDFAFDSDLGQLTEDKPPKSLGLPRGVHMSTSNTISPLAADLNLKIASVKKVWEMPAVVEGSEELQFSAFEEPNIESAPPNVCKVKPTQQLQSPPPQHYNHVGYQGSYGGLSVPSPPAVLFNSSQQLLGSSQQLPQQGSLYGAFQIDQSRGQFGGFPGSPYGASSAAPYNYHQTPPDMFQNLPSQYRMAAAGGGAAFGQSGQLGNNPSTVLIPSTSNSLISASVKPSSQQIGAIGSKGGGVSGVGGVGGVNTYQQQYLGYSGPVGDSPYSLQGLLPRPAPPVSSYYSTYQPQAAPAPTYPLQFTQPAQSGAFGSQFLSSQLQVAAAVQQMQQQYRAPLQQQYPPPQQQQRPPPQQQLKSPLHEHANGFAPLCESASPTPKGGPKPQKPPHSPPQHKYHAPPPHPPPSHTPHQHHQQQMVSGGNNGRCGGGGGGGGNAMARAGLGAPHYPPPIQRPHAPALPLFRTPPGPQQRPHHAQPRPNLYYHHHQRNGGVGVGGCVERAPEGGETGGGSAEEGIDPTPSKDAPPVPTAEVKAE